MGDEAGNASNLGSARHSCCGSCHCHHTRIPWATGPMAGWFPRPGLPWGSGVPAAGSLASDRWEQRLTRVRPWQSKYNFPKKLALPMGFPCRLCDPTGGVGLYPRNRRSRGYQKRNRECKCSPAFPVFVWNYYRLRCSMTSCSCLAEACRALDSSSLRGISKICSTPRRPTMEGMDRHRPLRPY